MSDKRNKELVLEYNRLAHRRAELGTAAENSLVLLLELLMKSHELTTRELSAHDTHAHHLLQKLAPTIQDSLENTNSDFNKLLKSMAPRYLLAPMLERVNTILNPNSQSQSQKKANKDVRDDATTPAELLVQIKKMYEEADIRLDSDKKEEARKRNKHTPRLTPGGM